MSPVAHHVSASAQRCWMFLAIVLLLSLLVPEGPVEAQSVGGGQSISGQVMRGDRGIADVEVTLHQVTSDSAGAIATRTSSTDGAFAFPSPPVDSGAFVVLFTTAEYNGVRYFGPAIHPDDTLDDYTIQVYDTSVVNFPAERIRLTRRDVVVFPGTDGSWEVNEIVQAENLADVTLVSPPGMPTWELRIPASATDFQVAEGMMQTEDVQRMGDRVLIIAPVRPGTMELVFRYRVPPGEGGLAMSLGHDTGRMNLLIRQPSPRVDVRGLISVDTVRGDQGETFLHYTGNDLDSGATVTARWEDARPAPVNPVHASLAAALLVLGTGAWVAIRGRGASVPAEE